VNLIEHRRKVCSAPRGLRSDLETCAWYDGGLLEGW
jgi:hypothetical protein